MQEKCELTYDALKTEINDLHLKALMAIKNERTLAPLFKGWKVFYSPLIYKPAVLFIGINPENGEEGQFDCEHSDKCELEYLHNDYTLAAETKYVFNKANKFDALYNSTKINYYYVATSSIDDLFKITNYLGRKSESDLGEQIILNARKWTRCLVQITEPKFIVCEGAEAYHNVTDLFQPGIRMREDVEFTYAEEIEAYIVGYKRIYSNIKDKEKLIEVIANLLP